MNPILANLITSSTPINNPSVTQPQQIKNTPEINFTEQITNTSENNLQSSAQSSRASENRATQPSSSGGTLNQAESNTTGDQTPIDLTDSNQRSNSNLSPIENNRTNQSTFEQNIASTTPIVTDTPITQSVESSVAQTVKEQPIGVEDQHTPNQRISPEIANETNRGPSQPENLNNSSPISNMDTRPSNSNISQNPETQTSNLIINIPHPPAPVTVLNGRNRTNGIIALEMMCSHGMSSEMGTIFLFNYNTFIKLFLPNCVWFFFTIKCLQKYFDNYKNQSFFMEIFF